MKKNILPRDNSLVFLPVLVLAIGLFFIYSASWREGTPLDQSLVVRQLLWMLFAVLLTLASLRFHYRRLLDIAWPLYGASLFLLVLVLFMPARLGARRWIDLGFFSFQPSEFAKLSTIFVLAAWLKERPIGSMSRKTTVVPFIIAAVPMLLILKEPDLGTALIFIPALLSMLYVWGFKLKWFVLVFLAAVLVAPLTYANLKEYQRSRIEIFLDPSLDPFGAGYTIIQSKIAVGSGGLLGKGFMSGTQTQLQFLPEKHTDFIFAVIGEEGGFVSLSAVLFCYWIIVYKGFRIAQKCHNRFGQLLATGITTLLAFQAIVNMAMTTGLLPVVGMPLLLVSYGGSSLVITMFLIGVLVNIGMRRDPFF